MGGQACVFYGGAEFSRDTDVTILASNENLAHLRSALRELHARRIAIPPFQLDYLTRGHAIHFRSYHPDAMKMRIDVMSVMRGVDQFDQLWERRVRMAGAGDERYDVISLPDLIRAKKTQRDKDWPIIRRLIEADYVGHPEPTNEQLRFWMIESRTPGMLIDLVQDHRQLADALKDLRKALIHAEAGDESAIESELEREQKAEREADRLYWRPLRSELEELGKSGCASEEQV
jgi:hypothetical protein